MGIIECDNCQTEILENMNYCSKCGNQIGGVKSKMSGMKRKLKFRIQNKVDTIKSDLDIKISTYLEKLEAGKDIHILAGRSLPENRKDTVKNALIKFQDKLNTNPNAEHEFEEWLEDLDKRLEEENCVVCFQKWVDIDEIILICKFCQSGGHTTHIVSWVKQNKFCPLCRESIRERDLIKLKSTS